MKLFRTVAAIVGASLPCAAALVLGCGRTGLDADGIDGVYVDGGLPAVPVPETSVDVEAASPPPAGPCVPTQEVCNGIDDDCNGLVDDGLPSIPCPGGGA